MADTPAALDSRTVAVLRQQAAMATDYQQQQQLMVAAEQAQQQILHQAAVEREVDLAASLIAPVVPGRVHELHTVATDWLGEIPTDPGQRESHHSMLAKGTVWYQNLPLAVRANAAEFVEQARGFAHHTAGAFGEQADSAEQAFYAHVAGMREREERSGIFSQAADAPMPGQPGDPAGSFTSGGGQNWLPGDTTSSNRAPQMQELATESPSQDVVPENDPGLGSSSPDPAVLAQEHTGVAITLQAVGPQDLEALPRCAKCHQPVTPVEMAHTANNDPVHGSCVGITGSHKEGQQMQTAPCPTCGQGRVAVRQVPQPSITDLVAGRRTAGSGLPQIDQTVDPSDTQAAPTPLPEEVAFPWTIAPGQVENTIGEAEQQIAQRETRKGAALRRQAHAAAREAYQLAYRAVWQEQSHRLGDMVSPQTITRHAEQIGMQAANEAARLVYQAGQDASGWMGDMGQGGVGPGQQDGGNPVSTNLGVPDPVYGYGGDNPNQPLKPYGADEAEDYTNNPGMNYQPGQPLQMDLGGRVNSTETPPGGGMTPRQGGLATIEANDPDLQKALAYVRNRRTLLARQHGGR